MKYSQIKTERRDDVLLITLDRPEKLNAWTYTMSDELGDAIEKANADDGIGAIVVTGAGRGFCAGADIEDAFAARIGGDQKAGRSARDWVPFVRASKPLIGAINGVAVGVGITMVLPFDILLASTQARVGMFFVKMGLVPELASSHFLVQRVGWALASEMCLTGRLYSAAELDGSGLFNGVVPADDLLDEALDAARTIAANPRTSVGFVKELLTLNGTCDDLELVTRREHEALAVAYESDDHKAAVARFLDKD